MSKLRTTFSNVKSKPGETLRWTVPFTAIVTIALSLARLRITPTSWVETKSDVAISLATIIPDPLLCLFLSLMVLSYWAVRDGKHVLEDTFRILGYILQMPGLVPTATLIKRSTTMGIRSFVTTIHKETLNEATAKGHAEGHAKGHAEGHAEGMAIGEARARARLLAEIKQRHPSVFDQLSQDGFIRPDDCEQPPDHAA